ncbi:MAG: putative DNA binding domain-containing protein [Christensenellaceae bacterium]|nr:putative DNA binding domain-containing protein [Christensenellaceae bacterium]
MAETTEYEFKSQLDEKCPESWFKTVSAFLNSAGGQIFFGVSDSSEIIGINNVELTSKHICNFIKDRISPQPEFCLNPHRIDDGKIILVLKVPSGTLRPYLYVADGVSTAFVRRDNESIPAPLQRLYELARRGKNISFDSVPTNFKMTDLSFTVLTAAFKRVEKKELTLEDFVSFGLCLPDSTLTYAGLLFADDCPLIQSRIFCTRWNGLTKSSIGTAYDSEEFKGDILSLLKDSTKFARLNSKARIRIMSNHHIKVVNYAERAVSEALVNALMHRNWSVIGSEVHLDIFDDRMEIYSPGGMINGRLIQQCDINHLASECRNPIIADILERIGYAELQGSGLKRILEETSLLYGYTDKAEPAFYSSSTDFFVILKNVSYGNLDDTLDSNGR